jgi:hypothetical protein
VSKTIRKGSPISGYIAIKGKSRSVSDDVYPHVIDFNTDNTTSLPVWQLDPSVVEGWQEALGTALCGMPFATYDALVDESEAEALYPLLELWDETKPLAH